MNCAFNYAEFLDAVIKKDGEIHFFDLEQLAIQRALFAAKATQCHSQFADLYLGMKAEVLRLQFRLAKMNPRKEFDLIGEVEEADSILGTLSEICAVEPLKEFFSPSTFKRFEFLPDNLRQLEESIPLSSLRFEAFDMDDNEAGLTSLRGYSAQA